MHESSLIDRLADLERLLQRPREVDLEGGPAPPVECEEPGGVGEVEAVVAVARGLDREVNVVLAAIPSVGRHSDLGHWVVYLRHINKYSVQVPVSEFLFEETHCCAGLVLKL